MFDAGQHFNAVYGTAVVYHFCRLKIEILADKYYDNVNRGVFMLQEFVLERQRKAAGTDKEKSLKSLTSML